MVLYIMVNSPKHFASPNLTKHSESRKWTSCAKNEEIVNGKLLFYAVTENNRG